MTIDGSRGRRGTRPSVVRRTLLWWFQPPANPYVSINFAVDATAARAYVEALAGGTGPRVTMQHLLLGAVGRALQESPMANAQVIRNRIVPREEVGIAVPVDLSNHGSAQRRELGLAVLPRAGRLSLREIAETSRDTVETERAGRMSNPVIAALGSVAERVPTRAFFGLLDVFEVARQAPVAGDLLHSAVPITTILTNVGATFAPGEGLLFRGAALSPPHRAPVSDHDN